MLEFRLDHRYIRIVTTRLLIRVGSFRSWRHTSPSNNSKLSQLSYIIDKVLPNAKLNDDFTELTTKCQIKRKVKRTPPKLCFFLDL